MAMQMESQQELLREIEELTRRLQEAEETLEAIRSGAVDALVVTSPQGGEQLFTLDGADRVYRVFLESISQGALTLDHEGTILYANAAAARLLPAGGGLIGTSLRTCVRRDERDFFDAVFEAGRRGETSAEIRLRGRTGGRPVYLSLRLMEDRGDQMIVAVLTDLTDRKRTEKVLRAERLARSILEQTGEAILVCDRDGTIVRASRAVAKLAGQNPVLRAFGDVLPLQSNGHRRFSLTRRAKTLRTRGLEVHFERSDGAAFDLILNADPLRGEDRAPLGTIVTLTDVTRLKQAEQAREELLREVEQANRELAAIESLSVAGLGLANLDQLVHSIVSQTAQAMGADRATLLLVRGSRLESAARVPPLDPNDRFSLPIGSGFAGTIAKLRRSLFVADTKASQLVRRETLRHQTGSLLGAPLVDHDECLGVLHVGWKARHDADVRQQRFLEIIAQRAAALIAARMMTEELDEQRLAAESAARENARLFAEQQRIAIVLQSNLIHPMPSVAGLDLGVVSDAANKPELVGGDLSDVFVVDDSHVMVLIADVAGKGIHAAGLTETVRSTVRALAAIDPAPAFVLGKTSELLLRFDPDEPHVTAFLAAIDPRTGHVGYASAGHPAPLHLSAATCHPLRVRFGPPLGSFVRPYASSHVMLSLDDYLVFYTDGVTEARRDGELLGEQRLVEIVSRLRGRSAQEVAEAVRTAALEFAGRLQDDLEVVALRLA